MSSLDDVKRHDLKAVFAAALQWLEDNLPQFSLAAYAKKDVERNLYMKPFGEMIFSLWYLNLHKAVPPWGRRFVEDAWRELDDGKELAELLIARPGFVNLSVLCAWFANFGFREPALDAAVRYLAGTDFYAGHNIVNYRRIELAMAVNGLLRLGRPLPVAVEKTLLHQMPEPWIVEEDVAYALTHEIFYLTAMGRDLSRLGAEQRRYFSHWIEAWLRIYEEARNMDVFGELLICSNMLGCPDAFAGHVDTLCRHQLPSGVFPGPRELSFPEHENPDPGRRYFLNNYHTTLVGVMALAPHAGSGPTLGMEI